MPVNQFLNARYFVLPISFYFKFWRNILLKLVCRTAAKIDFFAVCIHCSTNEKRESFRILFFKYFEEKL